MVQAKLLANMAPDLNGRAAEAILQPIAQGRLLISSHTGLAALQAVEGQRVPASFAMGFIPAANCIVVQLEKLGYGLAGLPIIKQQDRISTTRHAMIFPPTAHASDNFRSICRGKKTFRIMRLLESVPTATSTH